MGIDYKTSIFNWYMVTSVASVMAGTMYILVILLFSRIIGKWLGTPNVSLVYFVTIMFGVIFASSLLNDVRESGSSLNLLYIFDLLKPVILFITALLLYRLVIKSLSELTNKEKKTDSNLFIIPPTLFSMLYSISAFLLGVSDEIETTGNIIINIFTFAILFLFIWAFYVIIKNINATNEAIEAKELAAEMARMEAKIEADLSVAKSIQSSALPSVFPPFPDHKGFELFASMSAAKEVGGDFYDFYMLSDSNIGFLIADVSGKSIPGAMFMMTAKTVIKSLAESGLDPAEVFTRANERLCEGNDAEMFVTAWLGYLDLKTGMIRVANAGHNPPVLIRDGKAEYVILKPGLMLAGMDGIRYKEQTLQLRKGDILYLYTDGVTEAMDKDEEQYGEDRLQKLLSFGENYPEPSGENGIAGAVCDMVVADVTKYTADAEQSDDITMLCIRYLGVD
ncbi:MAG: SpoIIE family protein phosphatase [Ruminiclostridium sp.]|nr:SpoIIE family protein phosphatase [Ruminiclostridium sp.]